MAQVHFHEKITANNNEWKGIHPRNSAISHQTELPGLIRRALRCLPKAGKGDRNSINFADASGPFRKPTFITATRGPGMRGGLSTGLDMAKGLCLAFDVPFIGAHHMQAHALTPRLISALAMPPRIPLAPAFPFRSLLISGGHSLLVNSKSLTEFDEEISTKTSAAGTCIDKMAKYILPESLIEAHSINTNYGAALEVFAFPNGETDYDYTPPKTREELLQPSKSVYGWAVPSPLQNDARHEFSFTGIDSSVRKIVLQGSAKLSETHDQPRQTPIGMEERVELAREAQRVLFEHIADRIHIVLKSGSQLPDGTPNQAVNSSVQRMVVGGGVASNKYFRHVLHKFFMSKNTNIEFIFPPVEMCTDNALMIAWAGIEMWEAGWRSRVDCTAENRWQLGNGGLMGIGGWEKVV